MNERCFRPQFCTVNRTQPGRMRWILLWIMPPAQDRSHDLLYSSPTRYHCTKDSSCTLKDLCGHSSKSILLTLFCLDSSLVGGFVCLFVCFWEYRWKFSGFVHSLHSCFLRSNPKICHYGIWWCYIQFNALNYNRMCLFNWMCTIALLCYIFNWTRLIIMECVYLIEWAQLLCYVIYSIECVSLFS